MKRVIIMGSPRSNGRSAHLAEMLFEANIDERPEDELFLVPVSEVEIGPCIGCNACRRPTPVTYKDDDGNEVTEPRHRCVFDDDMQTLYDLLDDSDELTVVSPVYFSGTPALMKCVLDRLQPYFWVTQARGRQLMHEGQVRQDNADLLGEQSASEKKGAFEAPASETEDLPEQPASEPEGAFGQGTLKAASAFEQRLLAKRPATLHVVGEGGDPHGFAPLVSEMKSSLACAGFRLERVLDWVGKIDQSGEIIAEATEVALPKSGAVAVFPDTDGAGEDPSRFAVSSTTTPNASKASSGSRAISGSGNSKASTASAGKPAGATGSRNRPKLDLSSGQKSRKQSSQKQSAPTKKPGKRASSAKRGKSRG